MYVCRYISEQKATFGRGPDGAGGGAGEGEGTHTGARLRTHERRAVSLCIEPAERANRPDYRLDVFLLLWKEKRFL